MGLYNYIVIKHRDNQKGNLDTDLERKHILGIYTHFGFGFEGHLKITTLPNDVSTKTKRSCVDHEKDQINQ